MDDLIFMFPIVTWEYLASMLIKVAGSTFLATVKQEDG
jgi:hypothetical protein